MITAATKARAFSTECVGGEATTNVLVVSARSAIGMHHDDDRRALLQHARDDLRKAKEKLVGAYETMCRVGRTTARLAWVRLAWVRVLKVLLSSSSKS